MGKKKQKTKNRLSFQGFKETFSNLKNKSKYKSMSRSVSYGGSNLSSVPDSMISNLTIESRISDISTNSTATFSTFNDGAMALPSPPDHDPIDDDKDDALKTKKKGKSPSQTGS